MRYEWGCPPGCHIRMVWQCEEVRRLDDVIWADDETMEYRQYDGPPYGLSGSSSVKRAKRIVMINNIIYINPPEDLDERLTDLVFEEVVA